eukprot:jgi/Botrbrau1/19014/Bobra.0100s0046.1
MARSELGMMGTAVSVTARAFYYPSIVWNLLRNKLQSSYQWFDEICDHVILGAIPYPQLVEGLRERGVRAVVSLNEEWELMLTSRDYRALGWDHLHIPTVDFLYAPSIEDLKKGVVFISERVQRQEYVYVHCKAGRGRSTTLVMCYLVKTYDMNPVSAYAHVRERRPQVNLAQGQWEAVCKFFISCGGIPTPDTCPQNPPPPCPPPSGPAGENREAEAGVSGSQEGPEAEDFNSADIPALSQSPADKATMLATDSSPNGQHGVPFVTAEIGPADIDGLAPRGLRLNQNADERCPMSAPASSGSMRSNIHATTVGSEGLSGGPGPSFRDGEPDVLTDVAKSTRDSCSAAEFMERCVQDLQQVKIACFGSSGPTVGDAVSAPAREGLQSGLSRSHSESQLLEPGCSNSDYLKRTSSSGSGSAELINDGWAIVNLMRPSIDDQHPLQMGPSMDSAENSKYT